MAEDKFNFKALKDKITNLRKDLPIVLANNAQNYFSKSFLRQSWNGEKWPEVERRKPGTPAYKYPKKKDLGRHTRPILVGKGSTKLRRAVNNSIRNKTWPTVTLIVDLPYAKRHNEGLDGMPKRQYFGNTPELDKMQKDKIKNFMKRLENKK